MYILAVYVDDFTAVGKQGPFIFNVKTNFSSCFQRSKDPFHGY
jgi:hypothetical protein